MLWDSWRFITKNYPDLCSPEGQELLGLRGNPVKTQQPPRGDNKGTQIISEKTSKFENRSHSCSFLEDSSPGHGVYFTWDTIVSHFTDEAGHVAREGPAQVAC